ncbi:MAG: DUF748 domain-containing protein [Bacteroidota bacterium]
MPFKESIFSPRIRRVAVITGILLLTFLVLLFVVISPVAKYLIEKYDDKILGRTIELNWAYVNPFTGYVYLKNVRVYEQHSDTIFFKADAISADFSMLKLFKQTYEISSLTVYRPWGHIVQNKRAINFRDIIDHFRPKRGTIVVNKKRVRFSILDCSIKDGVFQYDEVTIPVTYFIKDVNVHSPGKSWDSDTMMLNVDFQSGPTKGSARGYLSINFKTLNYRFRSVVDSFDLKPISQYMKVLSNYGSFGGILNADIVGRGHFKSKFIRSTGHLSISVFHFGPSVHEEYGSFQNLVLDIIDADPEGKRYQIDSIIIDRPYFRYEKFDSLDNLSLMFGKAGSRKGGNSAQFNLILKIAEYLQDLLLNFVQSDYNINRFDLYKGNFVFSDFSLYEKFSIDAMPVHITADSIDKSRPRIRIVSKTGVRPYGDLKFTASLDPKNLGNFDIDYAIQGVPVSLFNPYLITYTSFPLSRGKLGLSGTWNVVDSAIKSTNHLLIMNPRVAKKIKRRDTKWIPMPLIMSLAREVGDVIDFEIPVKGDLKKPEFDFKHVILDVVGNIFIKPPATPYLMHLRRLESTIDKMLTMDWEPRKALLSPSERRFVNNIAKFLKRNPGNVITILPMVYATKEKEHIAFFEGKKKYFLSAKSKGYKMTEADSLDIEAMSVKDSLFIRYLDKVTIDSMMFTTEQKCRYIVSDAVIEARLRHLNAARKNAFLDRFVETGTVSQVKFAGIESGIPFNGFSQYRINYNGDVPEKLRRAYEDMDETNNQVPRKKYKDQRWMPKIKGIERKANK